MTPFTFTTHRAILDWHGREQGPALGGLKAPRNRPDQQRLAGMVSMTRHRITFKLDAKTSQRLLELCDAAIADPEISAQKLDAIQLTRDQLAEAIERNSHAGD